MRPATLAPAPDAPSLPTSRMPREFLPSGVKVPVIDGCFAAGTPLLTPTGSKCVEEFVVGDLVLSRDQYDPDAPIHPQVVEEVFLRLGKILALRMGRQTIRTTSEHPFWVVGKGWLPAREVMTGDRFLSHDGMEVVVSEVVQTDEWEAVYNLRVAEDHTYFVGCGEWGFSVWAHNHCLLVIESAVDETGRPIVVANWYRRDGVLSGKAYKMERDPNTLEPIRGREFKQWSASDKDALIRDMKADPLASKWIDDVPIVEKSDVVKLQAENQYGVTGTKISESSFLKYIENNFRDQYPTAAELEAMRQFGTPHGHHIVAQKGADAAKPFVQRSKELIGSEGIDWYKDRRNLVVAPNIDHTFEMHWVVWRELEEQKYLRRPLERTLKDLGRDFASGKVDWKARQTEWLGIDSSRKNTGGFVPEKPE